MTVSKVGKVSKVCKVCKVSNVCNVYKVSLSSKKTGAVPASLFGGDDKYQIH